MADGLRAVLRRTGTRARLVSAIALIVLSALVATFIAVYQGTGADLRSQVDRDLGEDASALLHHVSTAPGKSASQVANRAQRYINSQPTFGPASELFVVKIDEAPLATNEPELLGVRREPGETQREARAEAGEPKEILSAPDGYSTIELADVGQVRLLTNSLFNGTRRAGQVTVGEPLGSVKAAQAGISRTFLVAGSIALAAALAAGILVAGLSTRPLRRMAAVAGEVDTGDLSTRMEPRGPAEARRLAESFNHMLDRLEEAFTRQRAFVSDASHELRTPLTAIRGQIEVLAREGVETAPDDVQVTAGIVAREVDRMEALIDDMLLLAQADEGLVHAVRPAELRALLTEAVTGLARGLDRDLEVHAPPNGTVLADRERIIQVIRNLVRNAIEHTSAEGSILVDASPARGGSVRISVSDDGPGIPPAERDRIFVRFFRVESSRDRRSGGTGLGLAIARAIVEAHGGRIWADESPAGGARITFELPGYTTPGS
jgi:two-component system, OmpR family, sensor kinase